MNRKKKKYCYRAIVHRPTAFRVCEVCPFAAPLPVQTNKPAA